MQEAKSQLRFSKILTTFEVTGLASMVLHRESASEFMSQDSREEFLFCCLCCDTLHFKHQRHCVHS